VTFILSNGLQIRIPNNQLITPFVEVDRNGSRLVHQDKRELLMSVATDNPTTLGRYFFTAAYLMVDYDAHTFTMWQANPSAKSSLVPVVSRPSEDRGSECGGDGGGTTSEAAVGTTSISTGAIVGAALGAAAALGGATGLIFFFLRRRKRKPMMARMLPSSDSSEVNTGGPDKTYRMTNKSEQQEHQELPGLLYAPRELHWTPAFRNGSGTWTNSDTSRRSGVTYELDGTGMPPGYAQ
jgi:hypothetical protein